MSIQSVSATTNPYLAQMQSSSSAMGSEFKSLANALQSGDLKSAQDAYLQIQSSMQNSQAAAQTSGIQNQVSSDFDTLGKALQSGDLNAAKDALTKLGQDMQSAGKAHHHHHHHGGKAPSQAVAPSTTASSTTDTDGNSDSGANKVNVLL